MMLDYMGWKEAGTAVRDAVQAAIRIVLYTWIIRDVFWHLHELERGAVQIRKMGRESDDENRTILADLLVEHIPVQRPALVCRIEAPGDERFGGIFFRLVQLAQMVDNLIATGFLRMGIDQTGSRTMNFVPERLGVISDVITVLGEGVIFGKDAVARIEAAVEAARITPWAIVNCSASTTHPVAPAAATMSPRVATKRPRRPPSATSWC